MGGSQSHPRARWKLLTQTILISLGAASLSFMMWKSCFLAANILSSFGMVKPQFDITGVDTSEVNPRLRFEKDGTFKLSIFEDLHFGEGEDNPPEWGWGPASDLKTVKVIETILDMEKPNLVVLNGDLITGENTHVKNSTTYLDQIVEPLVQRQIPWASTYGNHDRAYNLSPTELLLREKNLFSYLSLTKSMVADPQAGVTNYVVPVFPSDPSDPVPAVFLWFFDSRGGNEYQTLDPIGHRIPIPGYVHPSAVAWFKKENTNMVKKYRRQIPSLAFVHIPIYAMAAFQSTGVDPHQEPGINDDNPLAPQSITNDVYTANDVPFMRALANIPGLKALFSGHDHGDDWCAKWDRRVLPGLSVPGPTEGLVMCFGRHTGYGGYGSWTRGSRQVLLQEETLEEEVETWVRLEDGKVSGAVVLNGTYGGDWYPAVENTETH